MRGDCTGASVQSAPARSGQRGAGRLKAIIWLLILAAAIYTAVEVVPVLYANYLFEDDLKSVALDAEVAHKTEDEVKKAVMDAVAKEGVPVQPEDIEVAHEGPHVQITVNYSVTVDLHVYQWTLHFSPVGRSATWA